MRVGGYTLDLYCDRPESQSLDTKGHHKPSEFGLAVNPDEFYGQSETSCIRQARRSGWQIGKQDICPTCVKQINQERE